MNKFRKGNKEVRKQPQLNSKEKKAAKHARQHKADVAPFLPIAGRA